MVLSPLPCFSQCGARSFPSAEPGPFPASCLLLHPLPYLARGERCRLVHSDKLSKKKKYRPLFYPAYSQPLRRNTFLICASPAAKRNILFGDSRSGGNALLGTGLHSFVGLLVKWLTTTSVPVLWQSPTKEQLRGMEVPVGCLNEPLGAALR